MAASLAERRLQARGAGAERQPDCDETGKAATRRVKPRMKRDGRRAVRRGSLRAVRRNPQSVASAWQPLAGMPRVRASITLKLPIRERFRSRRNPADSPEQRLGALDLCNRLLQQKPDRPCLLMHKATVQMALHELDACRETIDHLLKVAPGNPGGLAIGAMLDCQEGKAEPAVDKLQSALEAQQGKLIPVVYEAIGIVARTLEHHDHLGGSLNETAHRIEALGGRAVVITADLADSDDRLSIVPSAVHALGAGWPSANRLGHG